MAWEEENMQWGTEDEDGYVSYPVGIVAALPFQVHVEDDTPISIYKDGIRYTLVFRKKIKDVTFFQERIPYDIKKIELIDGKASLGLHYSEVYVFFTEVEVDGSNGWQLKTIIPATFEDFYANAVVSEERRERFGNAIDISIIDIALSLLNYFLSHYRQETTYYFTPTVQLDELLTVKMLGIAFRHYSNEIFPDTKLGSQVIYPVLGFSGKLLNLTDEQLKRICCKLESQNLVSIIDELIMSANNHFSKGGYRLALIEIETAFESIIQRIVKEHYESTGMSDDEIEKKLSKGIKRILRDDYPLCPAAKSFKEGCAKYEDWDWAYKRRNMVVHGGKDISVDDAFKAFSIFNETFIYLFDGKKSWLQYETPPIPLV